MDYKLKGNEVFSYDSNDTEMNILDFWQWHYCNRFALQDKIAEYIVAKALGLTQADNNESWTLYDMLYRNKRIEVKETSYYHAWQSDIEQKLKLEHLISTKLIANIKIILLPTKDKMIFISFVLILVKLKKHLIL